MDGWMDNIQFYFLFNSISVILDDGWVIMKGSVLGTLVIIEKIPPFNGV